MLSGISTTQKASRGCSPPCSASHAYADPVASEQPAGSALERSYPVTPIMLNVRCNDINGLAKSTGISGSATQDLVVPAGQGAPERPTPRCIEGSISRDPTPWPPGPGSWAAVPRINIFQFLLARCFALLHVCCGCGAFIIWLSFRGSVGCATEMR